MSASNCRGYYKLFLMDGNYYYSISVSASINIKWVLIERTYAF